MSRDVSEWEPDPAYELALLQLQCEAASLSSDDDESQFWFDAAVAAHDYALSLVLGRSERAQVEHEAVDEGRVQDA